MHYLQTNFNGGEFTPLMVGRPEAANYKTGCVQLQNFMVRPYGGVFKAPGTEYVGEVKDSADHARLIPFNISDTKQFILELGDHSMRFWRTSAAGAPEYLTTSATVGSYDLYDPLSNYGPPLGRMMRYDGALYMLTGQTVIALDGTFITANWTAKTAGAPYEWVTPWAESELAGMQWQQVNRTMILIHPDHPPYVLELPNDGEENANTAVTWSVSGAVAEDNCWAFSPLRFTFPPLRDHPVMGTGRTMTLNIDLNDWGSGTGYSATNLCKHQGIAYYCISGHTAGSTTEPGVGASWETRWMVAMARQYDMKLTASHSSCFAGLVAGDDIVIEPSAPHRAIKLALSANTALGPSRAAFIQGAFIVRSEWNAGASVTGTITLEVSYDNFLWEIAREWPLPSVQHGTISMEGEAPTEGAWYRLRADLASPGTAADTKFAYIEPVGGTLKLALRVKSITSSTVLVVESGLPAGGTPPPQAMGVAATSYYLSAFCSQNGYPAAVGFHNLRLWFGGTAKEPNRIRSSAVNDFFNFATGTEDDDGIDITLASNEASLVKWIASFRQGLVIGTASEEWTVQGGDGSEVLTPSNIQAIRRSRGGSKNLAPIRTRDALLWASSTGRKLFELGYVFTSDDYQVADMTARAEHLTAGGIQEMAFQSEPDPTLWCITGEGTLLGFCYNRQSEIMAWFRRVTDGDFESVATISGAGDSDQVWVIVRRTVNGSTKRCIERFYPTAQAFDFSTPGDLFYVDCGRKVTPTGSPAVSISGLTHLAGKDIKVWANGNRIESHTVSPGGEITLAAAATTAIVGLPIASVVQSMPLEAQFHDGTGQARLWRPNRVLFILADSLGGTFADTAAAAGHAIQYPAGTTAPFTGRLKEHLAADWADTVDFTLKHTDPTPFNALGYVLITDVSGQ